jgi:hypothetical protein
MPAPIRLATAALLLAAVPVLAQTPAAKPAPSGQQALLTAARHAYYLPLDRGVQGFSCSVAIDWPLILERATGQKPRPHDPTLLELQGAQVTVADDILKSATVTAAFPTLKAEPIPGSPTRTKQDILDHMVQASLAGWNPFLSDRILPLEGTHYHFESNSAGYRLTLDGGAFFSILDLDSQYRITRGETHLNGTVTDFTPTFDPSTHGWLITALETSNEASSETTPNPVSSSASNSGSTSSTSPAPSSSANKTSFTYTYQFVGDMLIPKHITVQVADGPPTPFDLHDCTLLHAGVTAESKAAPAKP